MLEDVPVAAADAGVLGHVHDPQRPSGVRTSRALKKSSQRSQKTRWEARSRSPSSRAAGDRLVVVEACGREVDHADARLPRAQAVIDVLVGHREALVEEARPARSRGGVMYMHAPVTASTGPAMPAGPQFAGLEAVAVVEPLGRAEVAHRATELDAPVGVEQLRAHDPDVLLLVRPRTAGTQASRHAPRCPSSARTTSRSGAVARRPRLTLAAKPALCSPATTSMPSIARSAREVLGAAGVVGDDHPHHLGGHGGCGSRRTSFSHAARRRGSWGSRCRPAARARGTTPRRGGRRRVAACRAQPQPAFQRREAQREGERPEQQRAPAEVVVGQVDRAAAGPPAAR